MTLSAGVPALHGEHAAVNQSAFFIAALYIVAIGTGAALQLWQEGDICLPRVKATVYLTNIKGLHEASQFTARSSWHWCSTCISQLLLVLHVIEQVPRSATHPGYNLCREYAMRRRTRRRHQVKREHVWRGPV